MITISSHLPLQAVFIKIERKKKIRYGNFITFFQEHYIGRVILHINRIVSTNSFLTFLLISWNNHLPAPRTSFGHVRVDKLTNQMLILQVAIVFSLKVEQSVILLIILGFSVELSNKSSFFSSLLISRVQDIHC